MRSKAIQYGKEFGRPSPNTYAGKYGWPEMIRSSTALCTLLQWWSPKQNLSSLKQWQITPSRTKNSLLLEEKKWIGTFIFRDRKKSIVRPSITPGW
jgi:hypothetical protein